MALQGEASTPAMERQEREGEYRSAAGAEQLAAVATRLKVPINDSAVATALDEEDGLASFIPRFRLPPYNGSTSSSHRDATIYFCGNSLGPQPVDTAGHVEAVLSKWHRQGINGFFTPPDDFAHADASIIHDLALVVGALPSEVVAMNTLTVNIHLMLASFYRPDVSSSNRCRILVEEAAFPSDMHAIHSHLRLRGLDPEDVVVQVHRREGEDTWRHQDIIDTIRAHGPTLALVFMSGLHYSTGQCFDMQAITQAAHEEGALVAFDLAHAVGNVELKAASSTPLTYKYLNGGPGAVGGVFVHERHCADTRTPRLAGWWGQTLRDRFTFAEPSFTPSLDALGFQLSTPSPVMLACLKAPLAMFREAGGMARVRAKSVLLTYYLEALLQDMLPQEVKIVSPHDPNARGCQLSLTFEGGRDAAEVLAQLQARGVVCDVRKPNIIRVAPMPLYSRFVDVHDFVTVLKNVLLPLTAGEGGEDT